MAVTEVVPVAVSWGDVSIQARSVAEAQNFLFEELDALPVDDSLQAPFLFDNTLSTSTELVHETNAKDSTAQENNAAAVTCMTGVDAFDVMLESMLTAN